MTSRRPVVVLLHGAGADCARLSWKYVAPSLAAHLRVLAPDLPGHGGTPELPEPTTSAYAAWLQRFLDDATVERASLVGLSFGGCLALGYALDHPHRVDRLVLVASYGLSPTVPYQGLLRVLLRSGLWRAVSAQPLRRGIWLRLGLRMLVGEGRGVNAELEADVRAALQRTSPGLFWRWLATELGPRGVRTCYLDRLPELRCPTLLVHGDRDRLVPLRHAQAAARRIPHGKLVVLRGCGHWPPRERGQDFLRVLESFLSDARS